MGGGGLNKYAWHLLKPLKTASSHTQTQQAAQCAPHSPLHTLNHGLGPGAFLYHAVCAAEAVMQGWKEQKRLLGARDGDGDRDRRILQSFISPLQKKYQEN